MVLLSITPTDYASLFALIEVVSFCKDSVFDINQSLYFFNLDTIN